MKSQMVLSILCRNYQLLGFQSESSVLAPATLPYTVLRRGVKLEAFFCLATFPILYTNSRSGTGVVCALNRCMLFTPII